MRRTTTAGPEREAEDRELFHRLKAGDTAAREQLAERFLPLARQLARRYQRADEPLREDLARLFAAPEVRAVVLEAYDISQRKAREQQSLWQTVFDPQTGLPHRGSFQLYLNHALARDLGMSMEGVSDMELAPRAAE